MTSRQESKLNMYNAVVAFGNESSGTISSIPALQTAFNSFTGILNDIEEIVQLEIQVISGITMDKGAAKKALIENAAPVAATVFAFATAQSNNELKEQVNFSPTRLLHLKDELSLLMHII